MPHEDLPFGPTDANGKNERAINEIVDVSALMPTFSFHTDPREVTLIIGRKGSGKTHALRFLETRSNRQGNHAVLRQVDYNIAADNLVIGLESIRGGEGYSIWERIWRCALSVAAASRFACRQPDDHARDAMERVGFAPSSLGENWPSYVFASQFMLDPFGALRFILERTRNPAALISYVSSPDIEEMDREVSRLMQHCNPTHFLLDGVDDFEESDPTLWGNIQLGIFWLAFRTATTTRQTLRKVYVTVGIRENVLIEAQKSEHADRFSYGTSLMILSWGKQAAAKFFRDRLRRIRQKDFWKYDSNFSMSRPEVQWLGHEHVAPRRSDQIEAIGDYIMRHTRCTPRDLISIGNEIAKTLNHASVDARSDPRTIEAAVSRASYFVAQQCLASAAQELVRSPNSSRLAVMPWEKSRT